MFKLEFGLENETHEIPWDFVIQMDQPIPTRRPYLVLVNKKEELVFCRSRSPPREYKRKQKIGKYLDLARDRELKRLWNMKLTVMLVVGALGTVCKRLEK